MHICKLLALLAAFLMIFCRPCVCASQESVTLEIPMRDGVLLTANLWQPEGSGPFPVVVSRTAYGRDGYSLFAEQLIERSIAMVVVDVRGRYDSGGEWEPLAHEAADGQDVFAWVESQPWCNGKIGAFGGSYDAWIQMLTATRGAGALDAMVLAVLPGDPFYNAPFEGGAYHSPFLTWAVQNAGRYFEPVVINQGIYDVFRQYPLVNWDNLLEHPVWWLDTWLKNWQLDDFWRDRSYEHVLHNVSVPILLTTGWFDLNQPGSFRTFQRLRHHSDPTVSEGIKLVVGPWTHGLGYMATHGELEFSENAQVDHGTAWLDWLENHLNGPGERPGAAVDYYLMGRNEWFEADHWPPRNTTASSFYLASDSRLSFDCPDEGHENYVYDPSDATPIVEPLPDQPFAAFGHYPHELTELSQRSDVLFFKTDVLKSPVAIAGPVTAEISFSSSAPDTDVAAQLVDVTPDGRLISVQHGLVRLRFRNGFADASALQPGEIVDVEINMSSTAYEFSEGHRIGVLVSSALFPAMNAHRNVFDDLATGTSWELASQVVHFGGDTPSRLIVHKLIEPRRPAGRQSK